MDALDAEIAAILKEFDLPTDADAIERVREDVDIAREAARDTAALKLPRAKALDFVNAAKLIIRTAKEYGLATSEELANVRRLAREANFRVVVGGKPTRRQWLGPCAANFRDAWERITTKASGFHNRPEPSAALRFATACCKLIDSGVNVSAVLRAYREFKARQEMTPDEYAQFQQSNLWRELSRSDL